MNDYIKNVTESAASRIVNNHWNYIENVTESAAPRVVNNHWNYIENITESAAARVVNDHWNYIKNVTESPVLKAMTSNWDKTISINNSIKNIISYLPDSEKKDIKDSICKLQENNDSLEQNLNTSLSQDYLNELTNKEYTLDKNMMLTDISNYLEIKTEEVADFSRKIYFACFKNTNKELGRIQVYVLTSICFSIIISIGFQMSLNSPQENKEIIENVSDLIQLVNSIYTIKDFLL